MLKILLTGSSGLLGKYLKLQADRPTHQELDITKKIRSKKYDLIVHSAAYTDVQKAEIERDKCFQTNVIGTWNLLKAYSATPFVYISTEWAYRPVNFYSWTKKWGEELVQQHSAPYLILRTLFKPYPWPYEKGFIDQFTFGDYITVIAPLIDDVINDWDRQESRLRYIGTGRKTMYELAKRTKLDVIPNSIKEMPIKVPSDYA